MVVIFPLQNSEIDILPAGGGIALAGGAVQQGDLHCFRLE
jgi:hypothetical protein